MKLQVLLAVSVVLNTALGVAYWLKPHAPTLPPKDWPLVGWPDTAAKSPVVVTNNLTQTYTSTNIIGWNAVESEDYRKYIANLRAIGCPEETIRDIIIADVNELFEARRLSAGAASTNKFEYWRTGNVFAQLFDEKMISRQQELTAEKRALLKELLGVEVREKPDLMAGFNPFETILDFLPKEKQNELMELEQTFAARLMQTVKDAQSGDLTAMKTVQAEKEAELLRILGPDGKLEYDLRASQTSMMMRMQMTDFQPSESEFRQMFQLRKAFDDQYGLPGMQGSKPADLEARRVAEQQLNTQMEQALGDRYPEYKYDQAWSSSSLRGVAKEHNIPKAQALKVFEVRDVAQAEAQRVRSDPQLTQQQRETALQGLRAETERSLAGLLGQPATEAYIEKGSWIKNLSEPAAPPIPISLRPAPPDAKVLFSHRRA